MSDVETLFEKHLEVLSKHMSQDAINVTVLYVGCIIVKAIEDAGVNRELTRVPIVPNESNDQASCCGGHN